MRYQTTQSVTLSEVALWNGTYHKHARKLGSIRKRFGQLIALELSSEILAFVILLKKV